MPDYITQTEAEPGQRISYQRYLKSAEWRSRRSRAIIRAGSKCQLCSSNQRLEVHHNCYDRLGGELPTDLVVLCHTCHERHHGHLANKSRPKGKGTKT